MHTCHGQWKCKTFRIHNQASECKDYHMTWDWIVSCTFCFDLNIIQLLYWTVIKQSLREGTLQVMERMEAHTQLYNNVNHRCGWSNKYLRQKNVDWESKN